MEQNTDRI